MEEKVIAITLWGNGIQKEKWLNWYQDVENLMKSLGYKPTHIGIQSKSFCSGKILTVARKKKDILATIAAGENPSSFRVIHFEKITEQLRLTMIFYVSVRKNIFLLS